MVPITRLQYTVFTVALMLIAALVLYACTPTPASTDAETPASSSYTMQDAAAPVTGADGPVISFKNIEYEFDKVIAGEEVKAEFIFVNKGNETLIIENVKAG
jgi:hypothetical protein